MQAIPPASRHSIKAFTTLGLRVYDPLIMSNQTHIVCTSGHLPCEAQRAWEKVCFYEHIEIQPSLLLRTVLPVPQRTTGAYRKVGDVSRCMYSDGGYLAKRITAIASGTSSVHMLTRYELHGVARLVPRLFINHVVKAMHKIVIRDMREQLAGALKFGLNPAHDSGIQALDIAASGD